ncbi:CopY/TcrY family copper transport repressor [Enterococcus sp. BWB1-3]|uniref:CopY/TcrY family copper transport repressor n=1 Tax=unclassified Enterococcus TaxID=2608891 RepID=UPI0019207D61|nr:MULTISPECIES: CopY/TcrY family copper transport repressor [unclassified Enterococcus]MBL1228860.1 CopY/TcrY family copper transport repressor [Enterococcus sp. BWB1-3]MCB5951597.1 CopY/TcrY family copper transport repressor [Enterococcus sp. BWT-B8]MCB5954689.1 CopY/TcrY family copper transport repressor [Enterococcus sp. CWB-B31]
MLTETKITDAEWEVMRVVWAQEETTSNDVYTILNEKMKWKKNTIKTLLSRLTEKQLLATKPSGNKFIYYPLIEERKSLRTLSEELLTKVCSRKVGQIVEVIIKESTLSFSDIEKLEQLLQEKKASAAAEVACNCIPGQCQCHLIKD